MALTSKKATILSFFFPILIALIFYAFSSIGLRRAPWYEEAVWNLITPLQRLMTATGDGVSGVWHHYFALVDAAKEREGLSERVAELEGKLLASAEIEQENARLRALLEYPRGFERKSVVARVIANDPRAEFKSVTIDRGSSDGIQPLSPVVGAKGLVGKVGTVGSHEARVLLINDPNSTVDVMVQRSRERGLLVGAAWRTELKPGYYLTRIEYLKRTSDIREGDVIVTSGFDRIFPPGIPVGTVADISMSRYGVFSEATIVPFEEMAELSEAMVLLPQENKDEGAER
jgi:rod shape-determining protein MreC